MISQRKKQKILKVVENAKAHIDLIWKKRAQEIKASSLSKDKDRLDALRKEIANG